ncbi:TPA: glycosyltransferase family 2 protein [Photobacterium damselae]
MIISIVTVTYNSANDLDKTISSIKQQVKNNYELIVIDGGSSDHTNEIHKKYESIIDCYISEPDHGIYDAMNKGLDYANGEFVLFLNAGDYFYDDKVIKNISDVLLSNTESIIFGRALISNEDNVNWDYPNNTINSENINQWFMKYPPNHQCVFFPREFYRNNRYTMKLKIGSDVDYIYKAINNHGFVFYDGYISRFILGGVSNKPLSLRRAILQCKESLYINKEYRNTSYTKQIITICRYVCKYFVGIVFSNESTYNKILCFFGGKRR